MVPQGLKMCGFWTDGDSSVRLENIADNGHL